MLKAENLQRTGSFKIRGAYNKLATLSDDERAAGVIAASAGNHGQAVAWAARELGIRATIYMPQDAPMAKVDPTLTYGGEVVLTGEGFDDALAEALQRVEQTGATFIHAFEDEHVIAGQGTIGLELAEQVPDVETVLIPVGGGGLASGVAIALRELRPKIRLVGVEVRRDLHTIADGIAVKHPGELTMEHPRPAARRARRRERRRDQRRDHAPARALQAARRGCRRRGRGRASRRQGGRAGSVCPVISGGNIDPTTLISVLRHGMTVEGRYLAMRTRLATGPAS